MSVAKALELLDKARSVAISTGCSPATLHAVEDWANEIRAALTAPSVRAGLAEGDAAMAMAELRRAFRLVHEPSEFSLAQAAEAIEYAIDAIDALKQTQGEPAGSVATSGAAQPGRYTRRGRREGPRADQEPIAMSELPTYALSLTQPWAWAVIYLPTCRKDIENRVWWTSFRGPIWVHATKSQGTDYREAREALGAMLKDIAPEIKIPPTSELQFAGIIGRATIVDCILPGGHQYNPRLGVDRSCSREGARHPLHPHRWHMTDQFGYVLKDSQAVPFVPCTGARRLWRVPEDLLEQLRRSA